MVDTRASLPRLVLVLLGGLLLAGASALAALDMVRERQTGAASVAGPMTPGFALSQRASALIATHVQIGEDGTLSLPRAIAAQARAQSLEALAREPLDGAALRNLAILAKTVGQGPQTRQLLLLAERVSRRDRQTNVLLAQGFAAEADFPATTARLDQALRTSASARREILPLLYDAMAQPGAQGVLAAMLADNVNWEGDFWAGAARAASALPQLASLRIERERSGFVGQERDDRRLLAALIEAEQFGSAKALFDALHGTNDARQGALRNGQFEAMPRPGAFDWDLRFDSKLTTRILPAAGELHIETFSDGGGLAARQLVALPGARYRLTMKTSAWDARDALGMQLRLTCAETSPASLRIVVADSMTKTEFSKPDPSCTYHWLDVVIVPQADRRDNSMTIDSIALVALPGE